MKPQIAPLFREEMRQRIAFVLAGLTGDEALDDIVGRAMEGFEPDPKLIGLAMDALFRYETDRMLGTARMGTGSSESRCAGAS